MSRNKELVKSMIECFNQLNADGITSLITDEVKHSAAGTAFNAELEGRDEFMDYIRNDVLAKFNSINFYPYNILKSGIKTRSLQNGEVILS